ncbi:hypothetical protein V495_07248, partial [Pseudogymnoascus sp. VKM F-4514 (FW-929)]
MAASNFYAIIAGVGAGTGRSLALKFSATYPTVFLLARSPESYESIVKEIKASGRNAIGISTDVASASSVSAALKTIAAETANQNLAAAVYNVGGKF